MRAPAGHDRRPAGRGTRTPRQGLRELLSPLFAGTSGWAYPEWRGALYPPGTPPARFLELYGRELTACEVNATFYRMQSPAAVERWAQSVPAGFRFAAKAHRGIGSRREGMEVLARDFLRSLAPLGGALAAVRLQLPEAAARDDDRLARLLAALAGVPVAFEPLDRSWRVPEVEAMVAGAGGTLCLTDEEGPPPPSLPEGPLAYVRLRAMRYTDAEREAWLGLLVEEARRRDVYVFTRHEGVPADDPHTGLGLARWLVERAGPSAAETSG